jgi:hypothetical protein
MSAESESQEQHYGRFEEWADDHPYIIASISAFVLMALGPISMKWAAPRFGGVDRWMFGWGLAGSVFYASVFVSPFMQDLVRATLAWLAGGVP